MKELWVVMIHPLSWYRNGSMGACLCQNLKNIYFLNACSLFYVSYTSIKKMQKNSPVVSHHHIVI